jgi:hypothetical protein
VRLADRTVELQPWSYCYGNGCVDGAPPDPPIDVGDVDEVTFEFPLDDWTFTAIFAEVGPACPRQMSVTVDKGDAQTYALVPAGYAGVYDVTLFGRGNGDLSVSFRWTTPRDGALPTPSASLAVIADHDGRPDSYGVELQIANLVTTPERARAEITVTAANNENVTFRATRADRCLSEGLVYWDGPDDRGLEAAALGPAPFTYDVVVWLDDVRYTAHATWPTDVIEGNEPSVALDFSPSLPGLR